MAVKIRLRRMGAKKAPFYRVVVADSRFPLSLIHISCRNTKRAFAKRTGRAHCSQHMRCSTGHARTEAPAQYGKGAGV